MKKRNRMKHLYWLILIIPLVLMWAVGSKAGIVRNATSSQNGQDSISIPFALLDTLGNPVAVDSAQDWGCMITYYPNGTEAVVDSFLLDASTNAQVRYNTARFRGLQTWYYRRQISDLDGTPINGTYSYQFILRDSSLHMFTIYRGEFQVYQSKTFADAIDSVTIDGSHLAGLTASISATTIAADAIGSSELATDAIDAGAIAADAFGSSELAATAVDEILDEALSGHTTPGTFGQVVQAILDSLNLFVPPDTLYKYMWIWAQTNASITAAAIAPDAIGSSELATDAIGASEIATDAIGVNEIDDDAITDTKIAANAIGSSELATTAGDEIADEVWDEVISTGHTVSGSSGEYLNSLYSSGVTVASVLDNAIQRRDMDTTYWNGIQDSVWKADSAAYYNNAATMGKVAAATGGTGASAADVWAYGTRTLTSGGSGTSTSWIALVDAPGTTANRQFVIDSTALGGANETGLTNIAIMVRDADAGKYTQRGIIERVNCVADNCTLQVAEAFLFDFEAGDSVFLKWDEPNYVIATLAEAAAVNADTTLGRDTTGYGGDATIAGQIVAPKDDTTGIKAMLANNEYARAKDSALVASATGNAAGMLRRGEVPSTRAVAESVSIVVITEDSARYPKGGAIDTARNASGLSGSCTGNGAIAFNLYFVDTLGTDEAVGDGHIALYTNASCTGTPAYWGKTGALGYIPFSVDTGTYWACASKIASVNATSAQYFHVTASSSDTVLGYGFATSTRAVIQGIVQVSGGPDSVCAYCDVVFEMVTAGGNVRDTVLNTIVLPTPLQGFTNATGTPLHASGQPFELHKTQNLVSTVGQTKYPVKWVMKVRLADGTLWQSAQFAISNSTDVVDIGEL